MEFVAICLVAVLFGLRGFRAGRRTYIWSSVAVLVAATYTYHFS